MAEEIDQYLLDKLRYALERSKDHPLLSKLANLDENFKHLQPMLENQVAPHEIPPADWPKLRREKLYYLNNVLTDWQMISKKWGLYTPEALVFAYNLNGNLKKVRKDLKGGDGSATTHDGRTTPLQGEESLPKESEIYRWSSRFVDPDKVHGLDAKAMSIERMLVRKEASSSFKAIGIVGMAGIGKTTLAQLIFSRPKVKGYFLPRIWVCMSKQPNQDGNNTKEIVKRILASLGIEEDIITITDKRCGLLGLIFALRVQLLGKRYLIVLDDLEKDYGKLDSELSVQDEELRKQLAYGLPKGCGGTVIVTSRDDKVAKKMVGEENLHTLVPLSDPDSCWLIFKDWVEKDKTEFPPTLENFKEEIVKKCSGLPLSARMMGQIVNQQLRKPPHTSQNHQVPQQPQLQPQNEQHTQPQPEQMEEQHTQPEQLQVEEQHTQPEPEEQTEQPQTEQPQKEQHTQPEPEQMEEQQTEQPQKEQHTHPEPEQMEEQQTEQPQTEQHTEPELMEEQQTEQPQKEQQMEEQPQKEQHTQPQTEQPT